MQDKKIKITDHCWIPRLRLSGYAGQAGCGCSACGAGGGAPRRYLGLKEHPESIQDLRSGSKSLDVVVAR